MPRNVLFVHGYSEGSLGAYFQFPSILKKAVEQIENVGLAAFDSFDDSVTIDDLADAMEVRARILETTRGWNIAETGVICHSTGAIIARRWILNRLKAGLPLPSHLVTMAGANHGSTLAHMGKSVLAYFQKLALHRHFSVGQGVLTDLEYGSDFLLRLNSEWMDAWNDGRLSSLYAFSMGGDTTGAAEDWTLKLFWQTHERGSDNTVRISAANLNYTIIDVQHSQNGTQISERTLAKPVPHLILPGYSHYGPTTGILGNVHQATDPPMRAVIEALSVSTSAEYERLCESWTTSVKGWTEGRPDDADSTLVFNLLDRSGSSINDCMIAILNQQTLEDRANLTEEGNLDRLTASMNAVSGCVLPHSPIQNDAQCGSYTFYLKFAEYIKTSRHWYHIDFGPPPMLGEHGYPYGEMLFTHSPNLTHTISPNESTYVRISLGRQSNDAYGVYALASQPPPDQVTFPPLPDPNRIA